MVVVTDMVDGNKIIIIFYFIYCVCVYVLIINVVSCPPETLIWKIKYLVSCIHICLGAGHKAKLLVLQYVNGVSSNPVEGGTQI